MTTGNHMRDAEARGEADTGYSEPADAVNPHAGISTDDLRLECARLLDGMLRTAEQVSERLGECATRGTESEGDVYASLEGQIITAARLLRSVRKQVAA